MFYFVWIPCGRRTSLLIVWLDLNLSFSGDQIDYVTNLSVFRCDIHPDLHLKRFRTKETLSGVLLSRLSASASASTTAIQSLPALMIISNERIVPTPSEVIVKAVTTDPNTGLKVPFSKLFASSTDFASYFHHFLHIVHIVGGIDFSMVFCTLEIITSAITVFLNKSPQQHQ
ncbi:unnamed protein product [Brassica rapa subsp. trilocularis]